MKVSVRKHGGFWVVSRRQSGKRKRSRFHSKAMAEVEATRIRSEVKTAGDVWVKDLSAVDRSNLISLYGEAKRRGVDLWGLLKSVAEKPVVNSTLTSDVITELIEAKRNAGRSSVYVSTLRNILTQFAKDRGGNSIASIGLSDLESFLDSKTLASRSTLRARLSTLFKFAIRRGYRLDNPCSRLEPVTAPKQPPAIFTPKQFQTCLQWLRRHRPNALPWFILTTCCGLRPEEAAKTCKADIHTKEGWIKVEAQTTKVRQRRVVYPKREAMALLSKSLRRGKLPIGNTAVDRTISGARWETKKHGVRTRLGLRSALGWTSWPRDITRHTAASYWLADCESTAAVARYLGHSETVLLRHYAALVTKEQAREFWKAAR